ncbi:MAG: hypothetical protein LBG09_02115 [Puniceicoccales bacterium]|jgi:hypothetical protein|nr:hypothetical protein [Puniceicoccales bacterium]
MGRILRDAIISFGFMIIFLGASSSFAGKSDKSTKRKILAPAFPEKEKVIQEKRDKFLGKLEKAIQAKNIKKIERLLHFLAYPPAVSPPEKKAMLRSYKTRDLAIRKVLDNNDDLEAMKTPFLAKLITAIHGTLPIAEYAKIHEDYPHIFVRES